MKKHAVVKILKLTTLFRLYKLGHAHRFSFIKRFNINCCNDWFYSIFVYFALSMQVKNKNVKS